MSSNSRQMTKNVQNIQEMGILIIQGDVGAKSGETENIDNMHLI